MTVCFPPEELPDREWETAGAQVEAPGWSPASQPAPRYYKLLSKSTGPPFALSRDQRTVACGSDHERVVRWGGRFSS